MADNPPPLAVDIEVLNDATAALLKSVQDMNGLLNDLKDASFTIHPAAFTLLDPGAMMSYNNVREYMMNFLATMETRFNQMAADLQTVTHKYSDNESGITGSMREIGAALDGVAQPPAVGQGN
jgi:hypothetical protein